MYLSNTNEKIEIVLAGTVTTNQLEWTVSYQDITSSGMTLPQSSAQGLTNNTTSVDMVSAPAAATNRQVVYISVYNDDTVDAIVKIKKDVGGTEYIYVNQGLRAGETLEWSREIGWQINGSATSPTHKFTVFSSNGTWTNPADLKAAFVYCLGGGGGGGAGYRGAAGTNRFGGGGGGGGTSSWQYFAADQLGATVAVTVGTGGIGGAGATVDSSAGIAGTQGGSTSFGTYIVAIGGNGGGAAAAGSGGTGGSSNSSLCTIAFGPYSGYGANGGSGQTGTGSQGNIGFNTNAGINGGASGGGGGGITNGNVAATAGGVGGAVYRNGVQIAGPTSGANPNGLANQSNFLHYNTTLTSNNGLGTGGAGGYPAFKDGGNGGNYGAGGGGGSGVLNGTTSGKGGDGASGLCVVLEIY